MKIKLVVDRSIVKGISEMQLSSISENINNLFLFAELRDVRCTTRQEDEENLVTLIVSEYFKTKNFI